MEDEKQLVRDLFAKPFSGQSLDDAIAAFNDLSGKDRRALATEFLSSPLGKDFESLLRGLAHGLAHAAERLAPQLEAVTKFDLKKAIRKLAPVIAADLAREKRKRPEITEAIIAVRGRNTPTAYPHTVAARILDKVNAWLREHGYKPVLIDALARRIPRA
jgi:hypothetical protein